MDTNSLGERSQPRSVAVPARDSWTQFQRLGRPYPLPVLLISELELLFLSDNVMTGPSLLRLGRSQNLEELIIDDNAFSGRWLTFSTTSWSQVAAFGGQRPYGTINDNLAYNTELLQIDLSWKQLWGHDTALDDHAQVKSWCTPTASMARFPSSAWIRSWYFVSARQHYGATFQHFGESPSIAPSR
jgi:hypothetical protein